MRLNLNIRFVDSTNVTELESQEWQMLIILKEILFWRQYLLWLTYMHTDWNLDSISMMSFYINMK